MKPSPRFSFEQMRSIDDPTHYKNRPGSPKTGERLEGIHDSERNGLRKVGAVKMILLLIVTEFLGLSTIFARTTA